MQAHELLSSNGASINTKRRGDDVLHADRYACLF